MDETHEKYKFSIGSLVQVQSRTWPGINKPGGVAKITRRHTSSVDGPLYDVKFVLGGNEKKVEEKYITAKELFDIMQRQIKARDFFSSESGVQIDETQLKRFQSLRQEPGLRRMSMKTINIYDSDDDGTLSQSSIASESHEEKENISPNNEQVKLIDSCIKKDNPNSIAKTHECLENNENLSKTKDLEDFCQIFENKESIAKVFHPVKRVEISNLLRKRIEVSKFAKASVEVEKSFKNTDVSDLGNREGCLKRKHVEFDEMNLFEIRKVLSFSDESMQETPIKTRVSEAKMASISPIKHPQATSPAASSVILKNSSNGWLTNFISKKGSSRAGLILLFAKHRIERTSQKKKIDEIIFQETVSRGVPFDNTPNLNRILSCMAFLRPDYRFLNHQKNTKLWTNHRIEIEKSMRQSFQLLVSALKEKQRKERNLMLNGVLKFNGPKKSFECFSYRWPVRFNN